jgi:hypothetical protein
MFSICYGCLPFGRRAAWLLNGSNGADNWTMLKSSAVNSRTWRISPGPWPRHHGSSVHRLVNLFTNRVPIRSYLGTGSRSVVLRTYPWSLCRMPSGKAFNTLARRQRLLVLSCCSPGQFGFRLDQSRRTKGLPGVKPFSRINHATFLVASQAYKMLLKQSATAVLLPGSRQTISKRPSSTRMANVSGMHSTRTRVLLHSTLLQARLNPKGPEVRAMIHAVTPSTLTTRFTKQSFSR